jgi:hypothetical protein
MLFAHGLHPAYAALQCGPQPEITPAEQTAQVKSDTESKAILIMHAEPGVNLRRLVSSQRTELRQKYPDVAAATLDSYLMWVACRAISDDPSRDGSQKFDEYADLYRILSEPIRSPAHAE